MHGVPHAAARELLDQRRGERGVAVGRVHGANATRRLRPEWRFERDLVDLDAEARARRGGRAARRRQLALAPAIVSAKRRWVARPWAIPGRAVAAQDLGRVRGGGDPDRPVERAREVGRDDARRSRRAAPMPPTLASFTVARRRPGAARRACGVGLVARSRRPRAGSVVSAATLGHPSQAGDRLLGELDAQRLERAQDRDRLVRLPGAVGVDADARVRPDAPRGRPRPARRRSPAPTLSLKVPKPSAAQRGAGSATARGLAGRRGSRCSAPAARLAARAAARAAVPRLAARSNSAHRAPRPQAPAAAAAPQLQASSRRRARADRRPPCESSPTSERRRSRERGLELARGQSPPRSDSGTASPSPSAPSSACSRSSTISRARRARRGRSRRARGTGARREPSRARSMRISARAAARRRAGR